MNPDAPAINTRIAGTLLTCIRAYRPEREPIASVHSGMNPTHPSPWRRAARDAVVSGAAASLLSAFALAIRGRREQRSAAGPNNGPSQWVYGRAAAYRRDASLRYTLVGLLVHHLSATGWALLHERVFNAPGRPQTPARQLARAATTAAVANFVDFKMTPKRLRPGFEVQLSKKSLLYVYAAFAIGLALASRVTAGKQSRRRD
jgi:hypothetical protein